MFSRAAIDDAYMELHKGLGALPHTLCFAVSPTEICPILKHLARWEADLTSCPVVSCTLQPHRRRGDRIVFSGVGKDRHEIREALKLSSAWAKWTRGHFIVHAESDAELEVLIEEAARLRDGRQATLRRDSC